MLLKYDVGTHNNVALLAEGVDRNRLRAASWQPSATRSPSSRRAWIEICCCPVRSPIRIVALLAEGVDRNSDRRRPIHF